MDINTHLTLKTSLAAYWTLDSNFNDSHSGARHGTFYNTPTFPVAKLRTGASLNGTTQYGMVAANAAFQTTSVGLSFWFKINSLPSVDTYLFDQNDGGFARRFVKITSTGRVVCGFPGTTFIREMYSYNPESITAGRWYHVVATSKADTNQCDFRLNGVTQFATMFQISVALTSDMYFGRNAGNTVFFSGALDDFGYWARYIEYTETQDLYQGDIGITWDGTFTSIKTHPTLRSGLLAHYKFDGDANDSLGNYNGTPINSPTYATGKIGQAVNLNGSTQYVDLGYHAGLNPDYISVCAWMKRDSNTGYSGPIGKRGSLGHSYDLGFDGGSMGFYCKNEEGSAVYIQLGGIVDGTWQLWAGVFDGSMVKVSLNGGEFSTSNITGKLNKNLQPTYLGRLEGYYNFDGCLDEITFHDRPLVRSEIQDLYNSGNGLSWSVQSTDINTSFTLKNGLLGYWTLDSNANDCVGTRHGTPEGSPTNLVCKLRNGYNFNGSSQAISVPHDAGLNLANYTFAFWVCPTSVATSQILVCKGGYNGLVDDFQPAFILDHVSGKYVLDAETTGDRYNTTLGQTAVVGVWAHLAGSFDGTNLKIYQNGVLINTTVTSGTLVFNSYAFAIARRATLAPAWFNGKIDELGVWNRALTTDEIADLYNGGIGITWDGTFNSIQNHPTLRSVVLGYWTLDSNANDSVGTRHGALENAPTNQICKLRNGYLFNGIDQAISLGSSTDLSPNRLTATCWFNNTVVGTAGSFTIFGKRNYWDGNPNNIEWGLHHNPADDKYWFEMTNAAGTKFTVITTGSVSRNVWHHGAVTYDGSFIRIYIDGALYCTPVAATGNIRQSDFVCLIGAMCAGSSAPYTRQMFFKGSIDEPAIFNRALTTDEIADLYNGGIGITWDGTFNSIQNHPTLRSGLLAYYSLDEDGTDSSGNEKNGTLVGSPTFSVAKLRTGLVLNGSSQSVDLGDSTYFAPANISVFGWVYIDSTGGTFQVIASRRTNGTFATWCWHLVYNNNTSVLYAGVATGVSSGYETGITIDIKNGWHHVGMTYDASFLRLYLDGVNIGNVSGCSGSIVSNGSMHAFLGAKYNGDHWYLKGKLDDIGIWSRAINADEIYNIYNGGIGITWDGTFTSILTHPTLRSGMLGYWTLDSNADDSSGNARHGTEVGTPTHAIAKLRSGVVLNGSSQYVNLGSSNDFAPDTGLSVFGWMYIDSTGGRWQWYVDKYAGDSSSANASWAVVYDNTNSTHNVAVISGSTEYWLDQTGLGSLKNSWHHVGFTYDNTTLKMYVDGAFVKQMTGGGAVNQNATEAHIGHRYNPTIPIHEYMKGKPDDVGIWSRALTTDEIADLYNGGIGITWDGTFNSIQNHPTLRSGVLGYWTLDSNADDSSGNARHGTPEGTPSLVQGKLRTCYRLNGTSQAIDLTNNMALAPTTGLTVACWVKIEGAAARQWQTPISRFYYGWNAPVGESGSCYLLQFDRTAKTWSWVLGTGTSPAGVAVTNDTEGRWVFLVGTWNGTTIRLYLNGAEVGTPAAFAGPLNQESSLRTLIGSRMGDGFLPATRRFDYVNGLVDDVGIWDRALITGEIADLYNGGIGITWDGTFTSIQTHPTLRTNLKAHWKLDANADDSVNGKHGAASGSPSYLTGKLGNAVQLGQSLKNVWFDPAVYSSYWDTAAFSYSCWLYIEEFPDGYDYWQKVFIGKEGYDGAFHTDWYIHYCASRPTGWSEKQKIRFGVCNTLDTNVYAVSNAVYTLNTWVNVGVSFDGTTLRLYINGVLQTITGTFTGTRNFHPTWPMRFGYRSSGTGITACEGTVSSHRLDSVSAYDRVLASSEMLDLYNAGNGLFYEIGPIFGTFASVQSGPWSDPATWGNENYPGDGSTVTISAGHTVTLDGSHTCGTAPANDTTMVLTINNTGWLKWADSPDANWTFTIKGNVSIVKGGKLSIGTAANPVPATRIATVSMPAVNTTGWKIQNLGTLEAYGAEAYHMADATKQRSKLRYNLMSGTGTTLKLEDAVDWQAGDTVSICNRNAAASFENLVIQSKVDAYTYTVNPTYCHLVEDFVTLVNRNVKFLGYDNAGRGVTIYSSITSATDYSGVIINLSWCSFKYFGRNTSTAVGTQMLYFNILSGYVVGSAIPDANFKMIGVVIDELSNNQPDGTIYIRSDMAFNGTGYKIDGLHFVHTIRKGIYYSVEGIVNSRNVTASYSSTAALYYVIFARWGNCRIDGLWSCSATAVGHAALHGFFTSIKNCLFFGGYGIYYFNTNSEYDNCRYSTVHESVVDNCKFYNCFRGIMASSGNAAMYGMNAAVVVKNCEFYANYSACVSTYGMVGRIRLENCTFDGLYDYSNTDYGPLRFGYTGDGSSGVLTDAVIANCTFGRYASMPNILLYCDGMTNSPKYSFVSCTVYRPWAITDTGYYNWLTYPFFRFRQFFADYSERWLIPPMVSLSVSGCKLWNYDGSGNKEQFSKMGQFRNNLLVAGSELRQQTVNLQNGKFPLRLVPWSCNVDHEVNRSNPITISVNPNKRVTASLKYKATGEFQRVRPGLRLFGPGIFHQTRMTVAPGNWETLTVQGDCNPDLTEGVKHLSGVVGNLVGYWGLNGNALDSHTGHLDGTVESGPLSYSSGKLDRSVDFNGSSQCVNLGTSALLNPTRITVCAWVKYDSAAGYPVIVSRRSEVLHPAPTNQSYWIMIAAGYWECGVATTVWDYFGGTHGLPVPATGWHFVALRFDGTYIKFCLDGVMYQKAHAAPGNIVSSPTIPTLIGAQVTSPEPTGRYRWWDGRISDVSVFNRSLTDAELVAIYRGGRGLRYELIQQYTDPTNVYVVMNAGAGYNEYNQNRPYIERWWPGRVLGRRSIGWSGMVDSPTIRVVTDVDSLAVVESAIPSQNHSDA